ncbi:MAG TPA: endolytic transglycosylase MltG [Candidatus Saccharimonadales bacterium]|nr:endolytic transglycosylase MltG [Candidatus Saccharimonadales bacterium]
MTRPDARWRLAGMFGMPSLGAVWPGPAIAAARAPAAVQAPAAGGAPATAFGRDALTTFATVRDPEPDGDRMSGIRGRVGYQAPDPRNDPRRSSGRARHGFFRFVLFASVLALIVLVGLVTVLRPVLASAVVGWASDNPGALSMPFVASLVQEDLGTKLTTAPSTDPAQIPFSIQTGDTTRVLGQRLAAQGLVLDARAFVFEAYQQHVAGTWQAGNYVLRKNMTPTEIVTTFSEGPPPDPIVTIGLREGLRLEQITAKLQTLTTQKPALQMNPQDFYNIVKHPPAELLAAYPWLQLPKGASLEGYLGAATYQVKPDISAEAFVRDLLDTFYQQVGPDRMNVPRSRGLTFYQVLSLASIVEQEAVLDSERPLIAGVYQNRLNRKMLLDADPTVIYANDTVELAALPFDQWQLFSFWNVPKATSMTSVRVPADLAGYQTYQNVGLIPGPICTPTSASIDAALNPNTKTGYLYFLARNDGSHSHAFAKTNAEQIANMHKYGYLP